MEKLFSHGPVFAPADPLAGGGGTTVTLTKAALDQVIADAAKAAVAAYSSKTAPVTGAGTGGRQVRLKAEIEPPHGDPVDRVGTVQGVKGRVLYEGHEAELLAVRFVHPDDGREVIEEHVADTLIGA